MAVGGLRLVQVFYGGHAADHAVPLGYQDVALLFAQQGVGAVLQLLAEAGFEYVGAVLGVEFADLAAQLVDAGDVSFFRETYHGVVLLCWLEASIAREAGFCNKRMRLNVI